MYTKHFGLTEAPFSIAPNPQYLYMSRRHRDALAHLLYGVQSDGGFILLTGEVGTGKTTLCRCLLEQVPSDVDTAFVLNPRVSTSELLATICDEFAITYPDDASLKTLVDRLNSYLLACHSDHKKAVLIIDEAQNLSPELLEQLRLLTNLETNERKLLQIILLGQPELLETLAQKDLRQFSQRITARFHLDALDASETREYIAHRLVVAGGSPDLIPSAAMNQVHRISKGIPRVINLICDRALLGAYAENQHHVTTRIIRRAAREVLGRTVPANRKMHIAIAAAALVLCTAGGWAMLRSPSVPITTTNALTPKIAAEVQLERVIKPFRMKGHATINAAYHDLFALWGAAFEDQQTSPCNLAETIGLKCLEQAASLEALRHLNRPVIVHLNGGYYTVSHLSGDAITVIAGSSQAELSTSQFNALFDGQVKMFWRMPPAYQAPLQINDRGAAVDWLVVQLSVVEGLTPPLQTGFTFNASIETRVRNFQSQVGLEPNGIVDPLTWIHLNGVEAIGIPTLDSKGQG